MCLTPFQLRHKDPQFFPATSSQLPRGGHTASWRAQPVFPKGRATNGASAKQKVVDAPARCVTHLGCCEGVVGKNKRPTAIRSNSRTPLPAIRLYPCSAERSTAARKKGQAWPARKLPFRARRGLRGQGRP